MAVSAGICSPASTVTPWVEISSSTAIRTARACVSGTCPSLARPRQDWPSLGAACASPTHRWCARRNSRSRTGTTCSARSTSRSATEGHLLLDPAYQQQNDDDDEDQADAAAGVVAPAAAVGPGRQ